MAAPLPTFTGPRGEITTKSIIVDFLNSRGGGPVKQEDIEKHAVEAGQPLPMHALEELYNDGIIDNPAGQPTRDGEPVVKIKEWEFTPYGERAGARHQAEQEKKAKPGPKMPGDVFTAPPAQIEIAKMRRAKNKPKGTGLRAAKR